MKKITYLLLAPFIISTLVGCQKKAPKPLTDEEIVQEAVNNPVLLLNSDGGIVYAGTTTQMNIGDFFLGMNYYEYSETQKVEITWSFDQADKWKTAEYKTDPSRSTLTPEAVYETKDEYASVITATAKLNEATATTTFKAYMNRLVAVTKSIKDYRIGFSKGEISASTNVRFYGYVTGKMDDTYAGVYVNSGNYGIMLYAGSLEAQWNANQLAIGDLVQVIGAASPYNGLFEVKPLLVKKATQAELPAGYELVTPAKNAIGLDNFNATELLLKDGSQATMGGLRYLGAGANNSKPEINDNKFNPQNHAYIWFSQELAYTPAYVVNNSEKKLAAYTTRTGAGTTEDPFVYGGDITTTLAENALVMDVLSGKVYRKASSKLNLLDMSKRVDFTKGYTNEGKFYKDSEHKTEVKPTYGAAFLDAETGKFYINDVNGSKELVFTEAIIGSEETSEIEVPCYYNYHQGAEADGASLKTMLQSWTIRETVVDFDGYLSWFNGPNLAPIGGADCFTSL